MAASAKTRRERRAVGRFVDRALAKLGLQRAAAPAQRAIWNGARLNRLNGGDWATTTTLSADQELRTEQRILRARARDLVRNSPLFARYIELIGENVVGPQGVTLQAAVELPDGTLDIETNKAIEDAWSEWCLAENCTVDASESWTGLLDLVMRTWAQDGEFLVRMVGGADNPFKFALQVIDVDRLDYTFNRAAAPGVNAVTMGVEHNQYGKPLCFHIWNEHPSEYNQGSRERIPVPADEIVLWFTPTRVGQKRGAPKAASVMESARMLDGYHEASLVAARVAAAQMGFYVPKGDALESWVAPEDGGAPIEEDVAPGTIRQLPPGYEFQSFTPDQPTATFEPFTAVMQRNIAVGLNVTYASLTGDLSEGSYASTRVGMLSERDGYRRLQRRLIDLFVVRVYARWLKFALLSGKLKLKTRIAGDYARKARWLPRGFDWIDPMKDGRAALDALEGKLTSRTAIAAEGGTDIETIFRDLQRENALAEKYGITLKSPAPAAAPAAAAGAANDESAEPDADDADEPTGDTPGGTEASGMDSTSSTSTTTDDASAD